MIIVCPECSTKFNVKEEKIPDGGTKVRCARCKHIFMVEKPSQANDSEPISPAPLREPTPATTPMSSANVNETIADDKNESDFSYDQFRKLDNDNEDETFSFGTQADENEEVSVQSSEPEAEGDEDFSFSGQDDNQEIPKGAQDYHDATPDQISQVEKKGGCLSGLIKFFLLLILILLIALGVYIYQNGPEALNQKIQTIMGQQPPQAQQPGQISLANLEGKFVHNDQAGELFLISGVATNNFSEAQAAIQVKGVIFDQNGKPLLQKTVFCGNPIGEADLQNLSFAELEEKMGNQFGKDLRNMKVAVKQSIPFDIVFKDLPGNLSEFSVKVTSSKSASE